MTRFPGICPGTTGSSAMERPVLSTLFILSLLAGCQSPPPETEVRGSPDALVQRWVEMWNSYDLDEVEALFLNDSRLTYFSSEKEGVIRGMTGVLEHHRGFGFVPGGTERSSRLWLDNLATDLMGDVAVVSGIWYFQRDESAVEEPQKGPVTMVALWESDEWRFVHMNFSEYMPQDSTRPTPP